ncbi:fimbrillin family protein [Parabacteroides timonensis]|uniref:fimbrillin family protein n=1 Tax=Parabacteroides timonensis TaxID=1871013 RepID=UPI00094E34AF|nr:fimbrillin family protein [Parabacteroides timonensis]
MKKIIAIATIVCLRALTACSDGNDPTLQPVAETTVCLEGAIGVSTRAVIGSGYKKDLAVCFARQDETGSGVYGTWSVSGAVRSGGAGNRPVVFDNTQLYPSDGSNIRLHGYYPAIGETDVAAGRVIFTIDGMTDVMATGPLSGNSFVPLRVCTFQHLLTQLGLVCYSDRADRWGEIVRIEVTGVHVRQQLDWLSALPALADVSSPEDIKIVAVQEIAGLSVPQVEEGGELPEAQGYILLPASSGPLQLQVATTKDGNGNAVETVSRVSVTVEGGFQAGKRHVVSLFFTDGRKIQATTVGVERWADQDAGEIPI